MAEILSMISLISFILSGICLGLALFFWFKFKIPTVIGDLSGRTAKKSIARMREDNEKSGRKSYSAESLRESQMETVLLIDENETAPLEHSAKQPMARSNGKKLTMLEEVIMIHTEEVIE